MFKHILLATDGSPASARAAQLAVGPAREHAGSVAGKVVAQSPAPVLVVPSEAA